jgi:hypothetical protein
VAVGLDNLLEGLQVNVFWYGRHAEIDGTTIHTLCVFVGTEDYDVVFGGTKS